MKKQQPDTSDPARGVTGLKKEYCPGCGGLRDPEYAKREGCFCCGARGTVPTPPKLDAVELSLWTVALTAPATPLKMQLRALFFD